MIRQGGHIPEMPTIRIMGVTGNIDGESYLPVSEGGGKAKEIHIQVGHGLDILWGSKVEVSGCNVPDVTGGQYY